METVKASSRPFKILLLLILTGLGWFAWRQFLTPATPTPTVVIYVAHDQDYSEPILKSFEEEMGIQVKTVYDTEATKTTGLVNRLMAEKSNPQADVFWNNEVSRTLILKKETILTQYVSPNSTDIPDIYKDPEGFWTGFAARARVLLVNHDLLGTRDYPQSLVELTNPGWQNQVALANPLFGTTASHAAALFIVWGDEEAKRYFQGLKANGLVIAESNGRTRDMAAEGEVVIGFTDTDDANDAIVEGKEVVIIYPDQGEDEIGTLVIPNSVMLIKGAKHPEQAKKLIDYLLSPEVEKGLAFSKAAQMPLHPGVERPEHVPDVTEIKAMDVTWEQIADKLPQSQKFLQDLFVR